MAGHGNRIQRSAPKGGTQRAAFTGTDAAGAFSTVSHSGGNCAMVSGVLPFEAIFFFFQALNVQRAFATGAGEGGAATAGACGFDFIKAAIQLSRPLPQPSSALSTWPSQPGLPAGQTSRTWKWSWWPMIGVILARKARSPFTVS